MDKIAIHPNGSKIFFNEEKHTYTYNNIKLDSVTTIIHDKFPKFNTELHSKRYAKKHGLEQKQVITEWNRIKEEACQFGNNVHSYCDNFIRGIETPKPLNEKEENYFKISKKFIEKLLNQYELIESEKIIFSPKLKLAGTVDLILKDKKSNTIKICDWKTNKCINKTSQYNDIGLDIFKHLDHCNFVHYSLQLNIYKFLLYAEGYFNCKKSPMILFHVLPYGVKKIPTHDMNKEISSLLLPRLTG